MNCHLSIPLEFRGINCMSGEEILRVFFLRFYWPPEMLGKERQREQLVEEGSIF